MRKFCTVLLLAGLVMILSSSQSDEIESCGNGVSRKSGGPPSCYAGEPPLLTTCGSSGCHEDHGLNQGPAQLHLSLGGADSAYIPGQEYIITVSLVRAGLMRGGFQVTTLQDNNISISPGSYFLTDTIRTLIMDAAHAHSGGCPTQSKTWIEHTGNGIDNINGDSITWQYKWRAPANNVGTITFYLAAIDANKDLDNTGDEVYTLKKQIPSAVSSGIEEYNKISLTIFPNPANAALEIQVDRPVALSILNAQGQVVHEQMLQSTTTLDIADLPCGIYFICDSNKKLLSKFVKQ